MRSDESATEKSSPRSLKILPPPWSSLLPAFASRLSGQPEPHYAGRLLDAALALAVVEVVQDQVVPGGREQTQVCVRVVVGLLLGAAVLFPGHL